MEYGLKVVLEGLLLIAVDGDEQARLSSKPQFSQDEHFDSEALDFLPAQVRSGAISQDVADKIVAFYYGAWGILRDLDWTQELEFFKSNNSVVKEWRTRARLLLLAIHAHDKSLVWDGFSKLRNVDA